MVKGIHVRYVGEGVHAVPGVGVFQTGTVAFAPREVAIALIRSGLFESVSNGPTAQAFIVRVEQTSKPQPPRSPELGDEAADFEKELEEEERRYNGE